MKKPIHHVNKITTMSSKKVTETTHLKRLQFASLNFIKNNNSETVVRAFITKKGFAAIPIKYFNNFIEIVWKENGREIIIDSEIYWQPDIPFVLLKISYENHDNPHMISKSDPS